MLPAERAIPRARRLAGIAGGNGVDPNGEANRLNQVRSTNSASMKRARAAGFMSICAP